MSVVVHLSLYYKFRPRLLYCMCVLCPKADEKGMPFRRTGHKDLAKSLDLDTSRKLAYDQVKSLAPLGLPS